MAKKGGNKKRCEHYRLSGHKEDNKKRKLEKHETKMKKFADKKASGNGYVYSKERSEEKILAAAKGEDNNYDVLLNKFVSNKNSGRAKHTPEAIWTSLRRKTKNEVDRDNMFRKEREQRSKK